eukprot:7211612-Prymnesium_polylepis.2
MPSQRLGGKSGVWRGTRLVLGEDVDHHRRQQIDRRAEDGSTDAVQPRVFVELVDDRPSGRARDCATRQTAARKLNATTERIALCTRWASLGGPNPILACGSNRNGRSVHPLSTGSDRGADRVRKLTRGVRACKGMVCAGGESAQHTGEAGADDRKKDVAKPAHLREGDHEERHAHAEDELRAPHKGEAGI